MIRFILNQNEVETALPPGTLVLDFIRYHQNLPGTKIGCREGDCGACTVLTGEIKEGKLVYSGVTSCLMAIGNAHGKHIVTIEGINTSGLNLIQQSFADEGATQCGFCTPGFIVSLAGFCISADQPSYEKAIDSVNGNICRCTGYKSIERAAQTISTVAAQRKNADPIAFAVSSNIIPEYFSGIKERLTILQKSITAKLENGNKFLGGGTDLYVQQHDKMPYEEIGFLFDKKELNGIVKKGNTCIMGAAATVADMANSDVFQEHFQDLEKYIKLISSTQIRNMATVGGNFINASPIGDLTIFFLALNAELELTDGKKKRHVMLRDFYKGYKVLDKTPDEYLEKISFHLPQKKQLFNFEKVSKRTYLDIASVNSAILIEMKGTTISKASISAGGVGPVPMYLKKASSFLEGKKADDKIIIELLQIVQSEISPISDARGMEEYKRLLLSQLIKAHFIKLFPEIAVENLIRVTQ